MTEDTPHNVSRRNGTTPRRHNGYKIPLMRNLVKRAIRGTGTQATTQA